MSFEDTVLKAINGDDDAFYHLIHNRKAILYKTAFAYVKNPHDALDILSDTTYKAYISIKKLKTPKFFNTWITRILINCALDHVKKQKKIVYIDEISIIEEKSEVIDRAELIDIYNAIDSLEQKYKTVVILKYFHDLTLKEISEVLESPIGTVKTHLHKALKSMRIELKEECLHGAK